MTRSFLTSFSTGSLSPSWRLWRSALIQMEELGAVITLSELKQDGSPVIRPQQVAGLTYKLSPKNLENFTSLMKITGCSNAISVELTDGQWLHIVSGMVMLPCGTIIRPDSNRLES